jgi:hypothetical protein
LEKWPTDGLLFIVCRSFVVVPERHCPQENRCFYRGYGDGKWILVVDFKSGSKEVRDFEAVKFYGGDRPSIARVLFDGNKFGWLA